MGRGLARLRSLLDPLPLSLFSVTVETQSGLDTPPLRLLLSQIFSTRTPRVALD
jgi:hypothetical protein